MWKLLPVLLLASCAARESNDSVSQAPRSDSSRIVSTLDVPLLPAPSTGARQPATKAFQAGETRGRVDDSGAWSLRAAVTHTRLRCATYETGIQLGRGNADCSNVRWVSPVQFGTRQTQCNKATLIHAGGGDLAITNDTFEASNCVRVVTQCDGPC
ncbi:hypothetical protein [Thiocystis violacea]|uniref:hypothetical protein n=1 Tax=Thiocystis violacea TaxID=13725 RepID=UPI001A934BDD|nr:hypothetical protein [Thiocystis violacea]MBK1716961.1 hypothetical protein [Thiocystis violacea]